MLIYPVIGIVSAAGLVLQISLTRVFAVGQWYHYAFLSVSLAFLGHGASGSLMTVWREKLGRVPLRDMLSAAASAFGLTTLLGYLAVNLIPFDSFRIVLEPVQLVYLALQYTALSLPFLCAGFVTGWAVSSMPECGGALYCSSLVGSGVGALVAPSCLSLVGEPGAILIVAVMGGAAGLLAALAVPDNRRIFTADRVDLDQSGKCSADHPGSDQTGTTYPTDFPSSNRLPAWATDEPSPHPADSPRPSRPRLPVEQIAGVSRTRNPALRALSLLLSATVLVVSCCFLIVRPDFLEVRLSEYKGLSQVMRFPDARVEYQAVSSHSRVTAVSTSLIHEAPGLSYMYTGRIPPQIGLFVDGESVMPVTIAGMQEAEFAAHLLTAVGAVVQSPESALVVNPKGGMDLLTLRALGVSDLTAVEGNPLVAEAVLSVVKDSPAEALFAGVDLHATQPRSFLSRIGRKYDLIQISLSDSFSAVTAGMYSLHEDYLYTVEGIAASLDRLEDGGMLQVSRWIQVPPSESVRLWSTVLEAVESRGGLTSWSLAAVRTWRLLTVLVKHGEFTPVELDRLREFASENRFDLVYYPGMDRSEANRYSRFPEPIYYDFFTRLLTGERDEILSTYTYDIRPATDDRPFFFHFFRWSQIPSTIANLGKQWQPFGGGGFLIVLVYLVVALLASLAFILLPLLPLKRKPSSLSLKRRWPSLMYFILLGLAFQFVEVPLMQKFILFLDHPTQAFSIVLGGMLVFTGIGSSLSSRVPASRRPLLVAATGLVVLFYPKVLTLLMRGFLDASIGVRCAISLISLAPLTLMGMPFPLGIGVISRSSAEAVPWAFAANGSASVIASILSALISLGLGFSAVLLSGGIAYLAAALIIARLTSIEFRADHTRTVAAADGT